MVGWWKCMHGRLSLPTIYIRIFRYHWSTFPETCKLLVAANKQSKISRSSHLQNRIFQFPTSRNNNNVFARLINARMYVTYKAAI